MSVNELKPSLDPTSLGRVAVLLMKDGNSNARFMPLPGEM